MSNMVPPLSLNQGQMERLLRYMQAYRQSALTSMPPTQERNRTLRLVQALQGKLLVQRDHELQQVRLPLSREEITALQTMAKSVLRLYSEQRDSPTRTKAMADVGKLYLCLKQTYG